MKFLKCFLFILSLSLLASACSTQKLADIGSPISNESQSQEDFMPMYFDSEEQLLTTINDVKGKADSKIDTLIIKSDRASEQRYSAKLDTFKLASISEFYKPSTKLKGISFKEITVKKEYVTYYYVNEAQINCATFTWFREMPPDVAMNELYGRGAMSEREIVYNGIKYIFLEWLDSETNKSGGYSIHWVDNGKAYKAFVPAGYSDDEMLQFCQFETVRLK